MNALGYTAARNVVEAGRAGFFGTLEGDLPQRRHAGLRQSDLTPQFGFVGDEYANVRVLLLGINPGNGPDDRVTPADQRMMPAHAKFAADPSVDNYLAATAAYFAECVTWPIWTRHCSEVVGAGKLQLGEIAYSNCLPWRTQSQSAFSDEVGRRAARLYAIPLIEELRPNVVIALGKRAADILSPHKAKFPRLIVWNRAQAATPGVLKEREKAAKAIFSLLGRASFQQP